MPWKFICETLSITCRLFSQIIKRRFHLDVQRKSLVGLEQSSGASLAYIVFGVEVKLIVSWKIPPKLDKKDYRAIWCWCTLPQFPCRGRRKAHCASESSVYTSRHWLRVLKMNIVSEITETKEWECVILIHILFPSHLENHSASKESSFR